MRGGEAVRALRYAGPAAVVWAWLVVAVAVGFNPWFTWNGGALSQLGSDAAVHPWIYNGGMMVAGALIVLFSLYMGGISRHWVQAFGAAWFAVAGILLGFVGYYHEGTAPHSFVSQGFFVQSALSCAVWGLGEVLAGERAGALYVALGLGGLLLGWLVPWPSTAWRETVGIVAVDLYGLLAYAEGGWRRAGGRAAPERRFPPAG